MRRDFARITGSGDVFATQGPARRMMSDNPAYHSRLVQRAKNARGKRQRRAFSANRAYTARRILSGWAVNQEFSPSDERELAILTKPNGFLNQRAHVRINSQLRLSNRDVHSFSPVLCTDPWQADPCECTGSP